MTDRTFVISLQDEVSIMTNRLTPHLTEGVAHYNNYLPIIELATSTVLSFDSWVRVAESILEYGVSNDFAEDLAVDLRNSILYKVERTLGQVQEFHDYNFRINANGDLWVTDRGQNHQRHKDNLMEEYMDQLRDSYHNGDYLPVHERRLIGV